MESPVEYLREQTTDAVRLYQSGGEHLAPDLEVDPDNRAVWIVHTLLKMARSHAERRGRVVDSLFRQLQLCMLSFH